MILYSYRRCPFAMRVRMVLEEKEISYQRIEENLSDLSAELLALHPEGRVPLLIHETSLGRQVIYQSTIITEYLDETFPQKPLMPPLMPSESAVLRAQVRLWTYRCDALFKPDLDLYKYELQKLGQTEREDLLDRLRTHFLVWNSALEKTGFLVGDQLTLADVHVFPFVRQFTRINPPFPEMGNYPALLLWLEKICARPAFLRAMAK